MNVNEQLSADQSRELLTEVKMRRLESGSEQTERADKVAREEPLEIRVNGQSVAVTMRTPGHDGELAVGFLLTEGLVKKSKDITQMFHCRSSAQMSADNLVMGGTGYQPVPSGDSPDGMEGTLRDLQSALSSRCSAHVPVGESPTGAGESPAPPIANIGSQPKNVLNVALDPSVGLDLARLTRHVFASSSCGVCGKASIESVRQQFAPVEPGFLVRAEALFSLSDKMRAAQAVFDETGGLHAAAVFDANGELLVLREDVGRHNAVDKVLGRGLLDGLQPFDRHILLVSGRASFEIMQKALAGRLPIVCAISAPSSLAVEFARENGQTLVGFLRGKGMNVYSHPEQIAWLDR